MIMFILCLACCKESDYTEENATGKIRQAGSTETSEVRDAWICTDDPGQAPQNYPEFQNVVTKPDISYGLDRCQKLDFYKVRSRNPTPLIIFVHGGGFMKGDKAPGPNNCSIGLPMLSGFLANGFSVALINYRFSSSVELPGLPIEEYLSGKSHFIPYLDGARALQFLRYNATRFNVNPNEIMVMGSSAGADISMWLGFHDDLKDPDNTHLVKRQSTKPLCTAAKKGHPTYNPAVIYDLIPNGGMGFHYHRYFLRMYGIDPRGEIAKDIKNVSDKMELKAIFRDLRLIPLIFDNSAITHLDADDPTAFVYYNVPFQRGRTEKDNGYGTHHSKFFIPMARVLMRMDLLSSGILYRNRAVIPPNDEDYPYDRSENRILDLVELRKMSERVETQTLIRYFRKCLQND